MKLLPALLCALAAWVGVEASTPVPTVRPTSAAPTISAPPTVEPTIQPTRRPTEAPTISPTQSQRPSTISPTSPTIRPTEAPSGPTLAPVTATPTTTSAPTYFLPTPIPASVSVVPITSDPVALHQLIVTPPGGNSVIQLKFYDPSTTLFQFTVESLPTTGKISQLSQVFSKYGYEPKNGVPISSAPTNITGSNHRLYYSRPTPDFASNKKWDSFNYLALRRDGIPSSTGTVTVVPPSGALVGSNFLLDNEKWSIVGNRLPSTSSLHEPYSRGALLNYYIMGSDDLINVASSTSPDTSLWYFEAPAKYYGNLGIAYGGQLQFTLAAFSGDFSKLNDLSANVVELECAACEGPVGKGITLGFSLAALLKSPNGAFTGQAKQITLPLWETAGWLKDSQNSLVPWTVPSQCDMIQVLSRLSRLRILGDWTTWYESVGLEDVLISNTKSNLPLCAMSVPDAKVCTC